MIADALGVGRHLVSHISESHLDPEADLCLSVISRFPVTEQREVSFGILDDL